MDRPKSRVALAPCGNYQPGVVQAAVERVLSNLEPLPLPAGGRILLKPNCLAASSGPDEPINTRAEVTAAVGRYLQAHHQAELVIADSGGIGTYDRAERVYRRMGLDRVAQELGADLLNLETLGLKQVQGRTSQVLPSFRVSRVLDQVDAVVNLPKLKTHMLTGMTGAVKNCLGLLPGSLKRDVHIAAPTGRLMSAALVDIFSAIVPALNVLDAVVGMEGNGPSQGRAKELGLIIASHDAVAADYLACRLMGLDPGAVATVTLAHQAGLGAAGPAEIELAGAQWDRLPGVRFALPMSFKFRSAQRLLPPKITGRLMARLLEAKPRTVPDNCRACGLCVESCPAGALSLQGGTIRLDRELCLECYCCLEHCPDQGLRLPRGLWDRLRPGR